MLTTKLGSRRTPVIPFDRGSVGVSLTEHRPKAGKPRSFRMRVVLETEAHDIPVTESELRLMLDDFEELHAAPTIEDLVPPAQLRLGDIITDLYDDTEVEVQRLARGDYQDRPATFVDYQGGWRFGTWIAFDNYSTFTVRLPRPPVEEPHPEDV